MLGRMLDGLRQFFRNNFIAGLLAVIPAAVTVICLAWVWQYIDGPLGKFFVLVSGGGDDANLGPWTKFWRGITTSQYRDTITPLIGLVLIVITIMLIGVIMRSIVGRFFLGVVEAGVGRLPLVGMLYGSVKQLGEAFISKDGQSKFQRAVAVQFPCPGMWAIGFVTGPGENVLRYVPKDKNTARVTPMITVFVPTTPLPSAGFMMVVPVAETMELDMSIQDALRMVVSGGMIAPGESSKLKASKKEQLTRALEEVPPLKGESAAPLPGSTDPNPGAV